MTTPIKYLALGDSYTVGEAVEPSERWTEQVAQRLKDDGFDVQITMIAQTGWTTEELAAAMDAFPLEKRYDLITLLIGVNNQYRGHDVGEYGEDFRQLLARCVELTGDDSQRVLVLSIPDWSVTPFAEGQDRAKIAKELSKFNAVCRKICRKTDTRFSDVTAISKRASKHPELIASDGLHPSAEMYRRWADWIYPTVLKMLSEKKITSRP